MLAMSTLSETPRTSTPRSRTVTKRELNQNTAAVLDLVAEGTDVVITERGKPRWRIVFDENPPMTHLERLEMLGLITPPNPNPTPWPDKSEMPHRTKEEMEALIEEMKGDH